MRGGSPVMQIRLRTPSAVGAQQFALDAEDIAVAAAEVVDRLDAGLLLNQLAGDLGAHAGAGARAVGDVDGVDAVLGAQFRAGDLAGGVHAARRQNLHERDELARRPAWRRPCDFSAIGTGVMACALAFGSSTVTASFFCKRLQRARLASGSA